MISLSLQSNTGYQEACEYIQTFQILNLLTISLYNFCRTNNNPNYQALSKSVELQRELGLRFRESVMIKVRVITNAIKTEMMELKTHESVIYRYRINKRFC